jgi:hypothetical protein
MYIAAKRDHDVAGLSCRPWSVPQNTAPGVTSSHEAGS